MGLLRWKRAGRAVEPGVAEGEHPAVRGHQPVAAVVGSGRPCPRWACSGGWPRSTRRSRHRRTRTRRRRRPPASSPGGPAPQRAGPGVPAGPSKAWIWVDEGARTRPSAADGDGNDDDEEPMANDSTTAPVAASSGVEITPSDGPHQTTGHDRAIPCRRRRRGPGAVGVPAVTVTGATPLPQGTNRVPWRSAAPPSEKQKPLLTAT